MFTYNGPVAALNVFRTFLMEHGAQIPAEPRAKLLTAAMASGITPFSEGMERLYAVAIEVTLPEETNDALLQALGTIATVTWQDNFDSKAVRAASIRSWAAYQVEHAEGVPEPAEPEVEAAYSTMAPEPAAGPAGPPVLPAA